MNTPRRPLLLLIALGLGGAAAATPLRSDPAPLPAEVSAHIAAMTPLFDGRSLDGWIQDPPYPVTFSSSDLLNPEDLARRYSLPETPKLLVKALNRLVQGPLLNRPPFVAPARDPEAEAILAAHPTGVARMRFNRLTLEDAAPGDLARGPSSCWVVKEGAMASTGAGRGVIYTARDYTRYRLIFEIRHVSGKPDHKPCFLIFCVRPAPGEMGLDALGGIQFQPPNGGHWDYRPGHNNAGAAFTRPNPTHFADGEWSQVEILVDARTGTARMAVAQPVGTRAVENLDFHDPAAGRTGPIAWQMHNSGLFDEYRNVRIEVDPPDDRLITTE